MVVRMKYVVSWQLEKWSKWSMNWILELHFESLVCFLSFLPRLVHVYVENLCTKENYVTALHSQGPYDHKQNTLINNEKNKNKKRRYKILTKSKY